MRTLVAAALLLAASPLAAQAQGGGTLPPGWQVRPDQPTASAADVRFFVAGDGLHVTTGPAAVLWNPANAATGEFRARVTFLQTRAPQHPEAYGLVLGGKNLDGQVPAGPDYLYFVVRGDGKYMVRHRAANGELHDVVNWTEHAAITKQDAAGKATNAIAAEAGAFGVRFLVNGQKVAELPGISTAGIVGLRVNHNLDLHVSDFAVERM
jgi:hypothetical protein